MTPRGELTVVVETNAAVRDLAMAGVRDRYPHASPREQFLRLAQITLGDELAGAAYPELNDLDRHWPPFPIRSTWQ